MKFKLDENLSPELSSLFLHVGHEAHTVLEERLSGAKDEALYARCALEGRVLVTLDLDFSNPLRFPTEGTPGLIVLRPSRTTAVQIRSLIAAALPSLQEAALRGRLWIIEPGRIRVHDSVGEGPSGDVGGS